MRRLLPATLAGRLIVTLLVGLLAAQVLGAVILLKDRTTAFHEASGLNAVQRIAGVVQVLDRLDGDGRRAVLPALDNGSQRVTLLPRPPPALPETGPHGRHLRATLDRLIGDGRPVQMVVRPPSASDTSQRASPPGDASNGHVALVVQSRLQDGQWLRIHYRLPGHGFAWPLRLLLTLVVLLASVIALTLLVVRWLTRPLRMLATAAEELGQDIQQPPVAETGTVEVRRAAAAFNTMQQRLRAYLQERERTLAAISHDLRTPITRLRLRAELIDDEALRAKVTDDLTEMEGMTAAALDLLRGAHSDEPRQPVDIMALLHSLQADAEEAGDPVTVHGQTRIPYPARPLALKRLFSNLIGNAVAYGTRATVTVRDEASGLRIIVADDGPGIPEEQLEAVFEPFYRIEGSRSRQTGGVGLGLAVARDIARAHGGELVLRNLDTGGLEAVLTLPR